MADVFTHQARPAAGLDAAGVAALIMDLQALGLRLETELATKRTGGAGPSDSGMLWIDGVPVTVPPSTTSPYVLRAEDDGQGIYRAGPRSHRCPAPGGPGSTT